MTKNRVEYGDGKTEYPRAWLTFEPNCTADIDEEIVAAAVKVVEEFCRGPGGDYGGALVNLFDLVYRRADMVG